MEHNYEYFDSVLPVNGTITDIGCGMGQLDFMLSLYHPQRKVFGIDYDEEKINIAQNSWLLKRLPNLSFASGDASSATLTESNAFVISDMLHYLDENAQEALIRNCASKLLPGGIILIRDSNSENAEGQKVTALSEVFSTKILKFNKTKGNLHFLSESRMSELAARAGLSISTRANDSVTSNTFYTLKKISD